MVRTRSPTFTADHASACRQRARARALEGTLLAVAGMHPWPSAPWRPHPAPRRPLRTTRASARRDDLRPGSLGSRSRSRVEPVALKINRKSRSFDETLSAVVAARASRPSLLAPGAGPAHGAARPRARAAPRGRRAARHPGRRAASGATRPHARTRCAATTRRASTRSATARPRPRCGRRSGRSTGGTRSSSAASPPTRSLARELPALARARAAAASYVREVSRAPWFEVEGIEQRIHRRFRGDMRRLERQLGGVELERIARLRSRARCARSCASRRRAGRDGPGRRSRAKPSLVAFYAATARVFARRGQLTLAFLRARGRAHRRVLRPRGRGDLPPPQDRARPRVRALRARAAPRARDGARRGPARPRPIRPAGQGHRVQDEVDRQRAGARRDPRLRAVAPRSRALLGARSGATPGGPRGASAARAEDGGAASRERAERARRSRVTRFVDGIAARTGDDDESQTNRAAVAARRAERPGASASRWPAGAGRRRVRRPPESTGRHGAATDSPPTMASTTPRPTPSRRRIRRRRRERRRGRRARGRRRGRRRRRRGRRRRRRGGGPGGPAVCGLTRLRARRPLPGPHHRRGRPPRVDRHRARARSRPTDCAVVEGCITADGHATAAAVRHRDGERRHRRPRRRQPDGRRLLPVLAVPPALPLPRLLPVHALPDRRDDRRRDRAQAVVLPRGRRAVPGRPRLPTRRPRSRA